VVFQGNKAEIDQFNQFKQFLQMTAQTQGPEAAAQILANQMGISVDTLMAKAAQAQESTDTNEYANEPWYKSLKDDLRKEALAEVAPIKERFQQEAAQTAVSQAQARKRSITELTVPQ